MEEALRQLQISLTILRPAWFIDNVAWDIAPDSDTGIIHSFLQPTDKAFPMVAAKDVGRLAAKLIREEWTGIRVVELEGPSRVTPNNLANAVSRVIGKPVRAVPVPRESWAALFRSQGMKNPEPRMRMHDGFNQGWIEFEDGGSKAIKGSTSVDDEIISLVSARS